MMNVTTQPSVATRQFELPQAKYALWYEVGERFGLIAKAAVFVALCDNKHKLPNNNGQLDYCIEEIKKIAARRSIMLH